MALNSLLCADVPLRTYTLTPPALLADMTENCLNRIRTTFVIKHTGCFAAHCQKTEVMLRVT